VTPIASTDTVRRKRALTAKLKEATGVAPERDDLRIEYLADPLDRVRSNADREVAVQRLDHQARLIHEIESALEKFREGGYGLCEKCDHAIAWRRLDAVPWARLCVDCQSEEEAEAKQAIPHFANAA
jgi:DnaK suppressor protein